MKSLLLIFSWMGSYSVVSILSIGMLFEWLSISEIEHHFIYLSSVYFIFDPGSGVENRHCFPANSKALDSPINNRRNSIRDDIIPDQHIARLGNYFFHLSPKGRPIVRYLSYTFWPRSAEEFTIILKQDNRDSKKGMALSAMVFREDTARIKTGYT